MLDEVFEDSDKTAQFTFGRIGNHSVVTGCLLPSHAGAEFVDSWKGDAIKTPGSAS